MYPYANEQHAMTDVLRLSRGICPRQFAEPFEAGLLVAIVQAPTDS